MNVRLLKTIRAQAPELLERVRKFDVRRFAQGGAARRFLLLAAMCAAIGWIAGDLMRESRAERAYSRSALDAVVGGGGSESDGKLVSGTTLMFTARGDSEEMLVAENVPAAIRKAREQGAKARERAVQEAIVNEMLGKYAKDRGWGQGGPYFPLGSNLMNVTPREKPIRTASSYEMAPAFTAMPMSVANPLTSSLFGPGNPGSPLHQTFLETFPNPLIPVVPEPSTWALLIVAFWALALRLRHVRRARLQLAAI